MSKKMSTTKSGTTPPSLSRPAHRCMALSTRLGASITCSNTPANTVLSAAFIQICGAPTVSFHLGDLTSTIDLDIDSLPKPMLDQVEQLANEIIAEDRPVTVSVVPRAQAEAWLAAGELRKLPPRQGDLRIVEIANFDRNACGGTHVRSAGQIGGLHLRSLEKVKQGLRVEFVCGLRAMRVARNYFASSPKRQDAFPLHSKKFRKPSRDCRPMAGRPPNKPCASPTSWPATTLRNWSANLPRKQARGS